MAEQKKTTRRSTTKKAAPVEAKAETQETAPKTKELSKEGRRRFRELTAERARVDARIKEALKLRSRLDAIDKELSELK